MLLELGKTDTLRLIYNTNKIQNNLNRYLYLTRFKWKCIICLDNIYLGFTQSSVTSVFCQKCRAQSQYPNYVTYQYVRVLKERQIALIESFENSNNNTINDAINEAIQNF